MIPGIIKHQIDKLRFNLKLKKIRIFVWDYDGTLYQNNELGEALKQEYFVHLIETSQLNKNRDWFDKESEKHKSWAETVSIYTGEKIDEIIGLVEQKFDKNKYLKKNIKLVKKINSLNNAKHVILSKSSVSEIEKGLQKIGFKKPFPFELIIGRDNSSYQKPDLRAFKELQKKLGYSFNNYLMIGDSITDDLKPAQKAGFETIHIETLNSFWKIHTQN